MDWISALPNILFIAIFWVAGLSKLAMLLSPAPGRAGLFRARRPQALDDPARRGRALVAEIAKVAFYFLLGTGFVLDFFQFRFGVDNWKIQLPVLLFGLACGAGGYLLSRSLDRELAGSKGAARGQARGAIVYRDATGDPAAEARVQPLPELWAGLEKLGFVPVCLLEVRAFTDDEISEVTRLFASPDHTTFAEPEIFFDDKALALRSALEDGTIVETVLLNAKTKSGVVSAVLKRWGTKFRWPRKNRPGAGYGVEFVDDSSVEKAWRRHQARLEQVAGRKGSVPLPHDSCDGYTALSRKGFEIAWLGLATELVILAVSVPLLVLALSLPLILAGSAAGTACVFLPAVILAVVLAIWIARHLPLARLRQVGQWFNAPFHS